MNKKQKKVEQVDRTSHDSCAKTREITNSVMEINANIGTIVEVSYEIDEVSKKVSGTAKELQEIIKQFKIY